MPNKNSVISEEEEKKKFRRIENSIDLQNLSVPTNSAIVDADKVGNYIYNVRNEQNEKLYKELLLSFYPQYFTVLLSIMFIGSIESEITL